MLALLGETSGNLTEYFNTGLVETGKWKSRAFLVWGKKDKLLQHEKGKDIFHIFQNIPGLVSLSVSVLTPCTIVKPHHGDTDAIYRIHIPVFIPARLPQCGLRVNNIEKGWNDAEPIAFCDAHLHEAWNQTDKARIILIADVVREDLLSQSKKICINVLAFLLLQRIFILFRIPVSYPSVKTGTHFLVPLLKMIISFWFLLNGFYKARN